MMDRKPYQRYSEEFRLEVIKFYFDHDGDTKLTKEKFDVDHASIRDWLKRFGSKERVDHLICVAEEEKAKSYPRLPDDPTLARQAYLRLQRELEQERLRSRALSEMIDQAEAEYRLPIRKKSVAGQ